MWKKSYYLTYQDKISNLEGYNFEKFLPLKNFGWTSGFLARDDLQHAHWDETEFSVMIPSVCTNSKTGLGKQCRRRSSMIKSLHCLPFHPHYLDTLLSGKSTLLKVKDNFHLFGNESTRASPTRNVTFKEADLMNIFTKLKVSRPYGFWGDDFLKFIHKFSLSVAMATNQIQRFG